MREVGDVDFVPDSARQQRIFRVSGAYLLSRWRQYSLSTQFNIVAAIVIGISMAVLGRWVASRIETGVITNTAAAAALYMDRFIEPHVQDLATEPFLSPASQKALSELTKMPGFGEQVIEVKIWRPDGTIVFSNPLGLIGTRLPISDSLEKALRGLVAAEFDDLDHEENVLERQLHVPLLEIYSPIREVKSGRIIAVAEFYQVGAALKTQLAWAQFEGALIVGGLSLLMLGALIGIVRQGSRTIVSQQHALNGRINDLSQSLMLNEELRLDIASANRRASESNERFLRRVSAELHDGPVQLIGLSLLRLDGVNPSTPKDAPHATETLEIIRGALKDALNEIRGLSNGLALPELENLSFEDALDLAISNHERRSGTAVGVSFPEVLPVIPASIKTCAYRFVQEGLNNAFRHAEGVEQRVAVTWDGVALGIVVSDAGPGISEARQSSCKSGIGLTGMRDRIESLGGTMVIAAAPGLGTQLQASFYLNEKRV
jgi:signal transduction histidine kinase